MNALEFLRLVLPPENGERWYVGFAVKKNPDGDPIRRQWSFRKIATLHDWLTRLDTEGFDVYYAVSSFKAEKVWSERDQKWHRRSHDNIDKIADLFADIDTRESHPEAHYADCEEASLAVYKFCRDARLPVPLWIGSGGGLHLHWPVASFLDFGEWLAYARGLKSLAKSLGLAIDPARTADASSILRPPGFHHWKSGRIVQVSAAIERFDLKLFEHIKEVESEQRITLPNTNTPGPLSNLTRAILGSNGSDPSDPRTIAHYCGQVKKFTVAPRSFREPDHYGICGITEFCGPGGVEWYESIIDPNYRDVARTKRAQWRAFGKPPTCRDYFHAKSTWPELCEACAFFKEDSTPLQLGRLAEKALREIFDTAGERSNEKNGIATEQAKIPEALNGFPILKDPWGLNDLKQLVHWIEDKHGKPKAELVSEHPIYIDHVHTSEATGRSSYTFKHYLPKENTWTTINVPAEDMKNGRGIPELLAKRVLVRDDKLFVQYMNEQLGAFQRDMISHMRFEQFGWKCDDTQFLFGNKLYLPGEILEVVINDALANRNDPQRLGLSPRPGGDVRVFTSLLNQLFTPDHYCAWFNILASFGAIFQRWHSHTEGGILLSNFTADSGKGKTKILNASAAIWGMWDALSLKHYDTASSQGLILAELGNLPGFIDEFAHFATDPKYGVLRLRDFLDMFGAGTDKHRALNSGVGIRPQLGRWQMNCHTASNRPVYDILEVFASSETAPLRRLFECDALPPSDFDPILGEELGRELWGNSGHAGDAFLRHTLHNLDWAKKALAEWTKLIWKTSGLPADHRFRIRLLGNIMLAGTIARDCGLITPQIDVAAIIQWGVEQIKTRTPSETRSINEQGSIDVLNQFMTVNANNTLRVQYGYKSGTTQMPLGQRPQKLLVRYETMTARLFAAQREFKRFLVEAGYPYDDVMKYLHKAGILKDERQLTLGAGTEYASAQVRCIQVDMAHPALTQVPREVGNAQSRL